MSAICSAWVGKEARMAPTRLSFRTQDSLWRHFKSAVGDRGAMNYEAFMEATGCKSRFFSERLFKGIDVDQSGDITFEEFAEAIQLLQTRDSERRIRFIFQLIDVDGSGSIELSELKDVLQASVEETSSGFTPEQVHELGVKLREIFLEEKKAGEKSEEISMEEFERVLNMYPDMLNGLSLEGITSRGNGTLEDKAKSQKCSSLARFVYRIQNRPQHLITFTVLFLFILNLFLYRFGLYAGDCKGVDLGEVDERIGLSRADVMDLANAWRFENDLMPLAPEDMKYMSFGQSMTDQDSLECVYARKRKLMSWTLPIAKGTGQAMKGIFMVILLPVSRNMMTTLQNTFLKHLFPFYDAIEVHRGIGKVGFFFAWLHTICAVVDIVRWADTGRFKRWSWAFPSNGVEALAQGTGSVENEHLGQYEGLPAFLFRDPAGQPSAQELMGSWFGVTGILLISIYTTAALFALDYPKKLKVFDSTCSDMNGMGCTGRTVLAVGRFLRNFNSFWYSHHLFAIFYLCIILHPLPHLPSQGSEWGRSDTWVWVGVPATIYFLERFLRLIRSSYYDTTVAVADVYKGNVVHIKLHKPPFFNYAPGMYAFINIPELSIFEWHPFTLTSSPGDNYLGFHIRAAGDWTKALYEMVARYKADRSGVNDTKVDLVDAKALDITGVAGPALPCDAHIPFKVHVDGPFGAPAQNFKNFGVMILVGAGIGVTPFASVLNDLLDYIKKHKCTNCGYSNQHTSIKKVYFYWTTRLRDEVVWFKHLLEEIAVEDIHGLFDINIHVTSFRSANDVRMVLLRLAQTKVAETEGVDFLSEVKTRTVTKFGRPDWDSAFLRTIDEHPDEKSIGVFCCGPRPLGRVLASYCTKYTDHHRKYHILRESFG